MALRVVLSLTLNLRGLVTDRDTADPGLVPLTNWRREAWKCYLRLAVVFSRLSLGSIDGTMWHTSHPHDRTLDIFRTTATARLDSA